MKAYEASEKEENSWKSSQAAKSALPSLGRESLCSRKDYNNGSKGKGSEAFCGAMYDSCKEGYAVS